MQAKIQQSVAHYNSKDIRLSAVKKHLLVTQRLNRHKLLKFDLLVMKYSVYMYNTARKGF